MAEGGTCENLFSCLLRFRCPGLTAPALLLGLIQRWCCRQLTWLQDTLNLWHKKVSDCFYSLRKADEQNLEAERALAEQHAAEAIATDMDGLGHRRAQAINEEFRQFKKGSGIATVIVHEAWA